MITVHIRKQGGAAIITIPADLLKILNLQSRQEEKFYEQNETRVREGTAKYIETLERWLADEIAARTADIINPSELN